jgi:transcriptional regulator with XRE-family HTH domain
VNTIGERIKHLRDKAGYSMGKLEKELGFAGGSFDKWEKDRSVPGGKALIELSNFFNVTVDWILTGEGSRQASEPITPQGLELLAKFYQLSEKDQIRVEERIAVLLELAASSKESHHSSYTGRGEAAAKQGA